MLPDDRLIPGKAVVFECPSCRTRLTFTPKAAPAPAPKPGDKPAEPASDGEVRKGISVPFFQVRPTPDSIRELILSTLKDLPPMPQVMLKARELLSNPRANFDRLAKIIETDQAIATKVLRYANSAYYGLSAKVGSVQHAAVVLGHRTLGEILTVASASDLLDRPLEGYGLEAGTLWSHSLAVASAAKSIATIKAPALADDAFTAGLIHDAGKLVLEKHVRKQKWAFTKQLERTQHMWLDVEKLILGFDHAEIAGDVCEKWQIPEALGVAVRHHHLPSESGGSRLAAFVHMADAIAMRNGMGTGVDAQRYRIDEPVTQSLALTTEHINRITHEFMEFVIKTTQHQEDA